MKRQNSRKTIKQKIFTFNLLTVLLLMVITAIAFSIAGRNYLERETLEQLHQIASSAGRISLPPHRSFTPEPYDGDNEALSSYVKLLRALRAPTSFFNVEYALVDKDNQILTPYKDFLEKPSEEDLSIVEHILAHVGTSGELTFSFSGVDYAAVVTKARGEIRQNLGKIVIYTNLEKINQIQQVIIMILLGILLIASLIVLVFSNLISKNISSPLSKLNSHIRELSERKFSSRFQITADNEIAELVSNINLLAQKLDRYDQSQKTFLQNVSHEFRTPIMSIQSHAEGIQYDVIEGHEGAQVILDETKRLTHLVEELLYLSRLDAIEEQYNIQPISMNDLIRECADRLGNIANRHQKTIVMSLPEESPSLMADGEKLERAVSNLISNCIRYASETIHIELVKSEAEGIEIRISDDGPGFSVVDLENLFTRFYKGVKGETGLGLAIAKSIIEKHRGSLSACNIDSGALYSVKFP